MAGKGFETGGIRRTIRRDIQNISPVFLYKKSESCRHELQKNLQSRPAILNCVAQDAGGRQFNVEILAERVRELKETQEGVDIMCREMDEIYREGQRYGEKRGIKLGEKRGEERGIKLGEKRGEERGIAKGKQEMAFSLLRMGMPVEEIAKAASVSVELVEKWLEKELHPVG